MLDKVMGIFDYRHSFYEFMKKIMWVFFINLLFIVTSLPIITIGASATAMYTLLQKLIKEKQFSFFKDYFSSFGRNFLKSTIIWLGCIAIGAICYIDIVFFINSIKSFGIAGYFMLAVAILITVVFLMFALAVFPILAEFEGSLRDTFTVLFFAVKKHIFKCFMAVVSSVLIMGFTFYIIWYAEFIFIYFPLIAFALNGFILSYIYDSILRPYYEEDEELEETQEVDS